MGKYELLKRGSPISRVIRWLEQCEPHAENEVGRSREKFKNDAGEVNQCGTTSFIARVSRGGPKKAHLKVTTGRGRKLKACVDALQIET